MSAVEIIAVVCGAVFGAAWLYQWLFERRHDRRMAVVRATPPTAQQLRQDAHLDAMVEMFERAALPCVMCDEIGEPHVCEREWWRQQLAHRQGQTCADTECVCHVSAALAVEAAQLWPRASAS